MPSVPLLEYEGVVFEAIDFDSQDISGCAHTLPIVKAWKSRAGWMWVNEEYWNKYLKLGQPALPDVWGG